MIVAFFGVIAMALILMFQPYAEPTGAQDWHNPEVVSDMAQHFIVYKNVVMNHLSDNPSRGPGNIPDSEVSVPASWSFPRFHHEANKNSNGWVYVWSDVPGAFYNKVYELSDYSVSVCRVISTRQCVRSDSDTATLPASLVPSFIDIGSTVYVWRH